MTSILSQPLSSFRAPDKAARPSSRSAVRPEPRHPGSVELASRLGLGWSLRQHHRPSRTSRPSPNHAGNQQALPRLQHYYEPSDSSKGIGSRFPHRLSLHLPATGRSDRPGHTWTTGHTTVHVVVTTRTHWTLRGLPGSPRQQCRHGLPEPPAGAPTAKVVPVDAVATCDVWHPHDEVIGFPVRRRVTTPTGLLPVHYSFSPTASPPPPPHPSSPRRTGHQLPNFNDQSSRRTHTSLPDEAARRTTRRWGGPPATPSSRHGAVSRVSVPDRAAP